MRSTTIVVLVSALSAACSGGTGDVMDAARPDAGSPDAPAHDAGDPPDAASPEGGLPDAGPGCPANPAVVRVMGDITADTTWTCESTYVLAAPVFVRAPAVLSVRAGTVVRGDAMSALVVTRGARIDATGTAAAPVVFTSSKARGMRRRGDWGGLVLLGAAPINVQGGTNAVEGLSPMDDRGTYGGSDEGHPCGRLRYARIEFAGFTFGTDNELNGLTVAGCGRATELDYVQVHMGEDDGIEFFGGTADLRHAVITRAKDDGLDWDQGWRGRAQFLVIQQDAANGDTAIEADNLEASHDATPRSLPTLYNATLVGSADPAAQGLGVVLRRGTGAMIHNAIVTGFRREAIDVRDASSAGQARAGALTLSTSIVSAIGADDATFFPNEADDDGGFAEAAFFMEPSRGNRFGVDVMMAAAQSVTAPRFAPAEASPAATGAAAPPSDGFFDPSAAFVGAVRPGAGPTWLDGWTAFPEN